MVCQPSKEKLGLQKLCTTFCKPSNSLAQAFCYEELNAGLSLATMQGVHCHSLFDLPQTSRAASVFSWLFLCQSMMVFPQRFEPGTQPHRNTQKNPAVVAEPVCGLCLTGGGKGIGNRKSRPAVRTARRKTKIIIQESE